MVQHQGRESQEREPDLSPRQDLAWMLWWLACAAAEYGQDKAARIGEVAAEIQMEGEMGYYFNPPQDLPKVARPIEGRNFLELQDKLEDGERLFGHYDRFMFQNAVYLFSAEEMEEFERQYRQGLILRLGFYAMPEDVFKEHFPYLMEDESASVQRD